MRLKYLWILGVCAALGCGDDTIKPGDDDGLRSANNLNNRAGNNTNNANTNNVNNTNNTNNSNNVLMVENCMPGQTAGCATETDLYVCNDEGSAYVGQTCSNGQRCLVDKCSSDLCVPGTLTCEGGESVKVCNPDGQSFGAPTACPDDTVCDAGSCKAICELGKYQSSYVGCEYWTVDLDQYTDPFTNPKPDEVPHSVVISNPNNKTATIAFYSQVVGASVNVADPTVPANSVKAFTMPRLDVSGTGVTKNAINIVSSIPVSAHQFSPLNNANVYSNDASLLLPVNTLGYEYIVVNWPSQMIPCIPGLGSCPEPQHSYVTIVAVEPGATGINVTSTATMTPGPNINSFPAGVTRGFSLQRGEVLNLQAGDPNGFGGANDLTGTVILANKKIMVFAGHEEAVINPPGGGNGGGDEGGGSTTCCADHLEQQLFPLDSWDTTYQATLSPGRGEKVDHWKIVAGEDNVTVTTNPPQDGAASVTLNKGQSVSFFSGDNFEVNATGKISVAQFLVSQSSTTTGTGDPAMILSVPTARYRQDYVLLTPSGYRNDYISIIRKSGESVTLNGAAVTATFAPIGGGGWEVGHVEVQAGIQNLEGSAPFGVMAYGFDTAVSYGYPGGLNLVGDEVTP